MIKNEVIRSIAELLANEIIEDVGMSAIERADAELIDTSVQESLDAIENRTNEVLLAKANAIQTEFVVERWWEDR